MLRNKIPPTYMQVFLLHKLQAQIFFYKSSSFAFMQNIYSPEKQVRCNSSISVLMFLVSLELSVVSKISLQKDFHVMKRAFSII